MFRRRPGCFLYPHRNFWETTTWIAHTTTRRHILAAAAAAAGTSLIGLPAWAQANYPSKPIRFVVPFNPGGATDIVARVLAEAMSRQLGQPIIVENKAGASAMLGTDQVAKSAPDGYNVVVSLSTSLLINQFLYSKMAYNPQKDLLMLSEIASAPSHWWSILLCLPTTCRSCWPG